LVGAGITLCGCGPAKTTDPPANPKTPPTPVELAWGNHFAAFGAGANQKDDATMKAALDQIMIDYDNESMVAVFNDKCDGNKGTTTQRNGYTEFKTETEIRGFFSNLFTQLGSADNLDKVGPIDSGKKEGAPVVLSGNKLIRGNVFLTWSTKDLTGVNVIDWATDSFSWQTKDGVAKVWKQNIVATEPGKTCGEAAVVARDCSDNQKVCDRWDNHFAAFVAGQGFTDDTELEAALTKIMLDYTADSIVQVFDTRTQAYDKFDTPAAIKEMFKQLFTAMQEAKTDDGNGLATKLLEVEPKFNGVFLVWESTSHPKATDTFVFDDDGLIIRQNIVVQTKAPAEVKVQV